MNRIEELIAEYLKNKHPEAIKRKTTEEEKQKIKDPQAVNSPLLKSNMFSKAPKEDNE